MDSLARKITGDLDGDDFIRVVWLSGEFPTLLTLLKNHETNSFYASQERYFSSLVATGCSDL